MAQKKPGDHDIHDEFAEFLIESGVDAISVSPDSFVQLKRHVAATERREQPSAQ